MKLFKMLVLFGMMVGSVSSGYVFALSLGNVKLLSKLNQPLKAEIELFEVKRLQSSEIFANLAGESDFERAGIRRPFSLSELQFKTHVNSDGTGFIKVTSKSLMQEPFVNFLLEVYWPNGRVMREYTLLMDPPLFDNEAIALVEAPVSQSPVSFPVTELQEPTLIQSVESKTIAVDPSAPQYPVANSGGGKSNGERYKVKAHDSLWVIANRLSSANENVSVEQTMMALQRLNPNAFLKHNINWVKRGAILQIPDIETTQILSHKQAVWQIAMQNKAWRDGKIQQPIDAKRSHYSDVRKKATDSGFNSRLSIIAPESLTDKEGAGSDTAKERERAVQNELLMTQESLIKLSRQNEELRSRLQDLNEQVNTLTKLMTLKVNQMAALQSSEGGKTSPDFNVVGEKIDLADSKMHAMVPEKTFKKDSKQAANPEAQFQQVKTDNKVEQKLNFGSKPKPEPKPESKPEPDQTAEPSFFGSTLFFILMALIPVAGAVGFMCYKHFKDRDELLEEDFLDLGNLAEDDELASLHSANNGENLSIDKQVSLGGAESNKEDPLVVADAHIAYGRFEEAITLLKGAIDKSPDRTDLIVKLLEVYAESSDADSFNEQFAKLENMADLDALKSAEVFKARFPEGTFSDQSGQSGGQNGASADEDDFSSMGFDLSNNDFDLGDFDDSISDLDIDLDGSDINLDVSTDSTDQQKEFEPAVEEELPLDFEEDIARDSGLESATQELLAAEDKAGSSHELQFDADSDLVGSPEEASSEVVDEDLPSLDFDIDDLGLDGKNNENPVATDTSNDATAAELDFESVSMSEEDTNADLSELVADSDALAVTDDLNLPGVDSFGLEADGADLDLGGAVDSSDDNNFDFDDIDDELNALYDDEVEIKLDLARAYLDMGDRDGASDILDEVLELGTQQQKDVATELLSQV